MAIVYGVMISLITLGAAMGMASPATPIIMTIIALIDLNR